MREDDSNKKSDHHRVCNRIKARKVVLLEFSDDSIVRGYSVDISPRGIFLTADVEPERDLQGLPARVYVISDKGQFSNAYPCKVVRHAGLELAVENDKGEAAAFGNEMTRALLGV